MLDVPLPMLREAIRVFLECAYPDGRIPEVVQGRSTFDQTRSATELLNEVPFERYRSEAPFPCTVYALRLGSAQYPHLKMEVRPFPSPPGFLFWVNTHDRFFTVDARCRDAEQWRELTQRNQELKQRIETAWAAARLPTYTAAMREALDSSPPG